MLSLILLAQAAEEQFKRMTPEEQVQVKADELFRNALTWKLLLLSIVVTVGAFHLHPVAGIISAVLGWYNSAQVPHTILNIRHDGFNRWNLAWPIFGNILFPTLILAFCWYGPLPGIW